MIEKPSRVCAADLVGTPYKLAGKGPRHFDCFGLIQFWFRENYQIDVGEYTREPAHAWKQIIGISSADKWTRLDQPEEGAVMAMSRSKAFHHVGIWTEGKCLHAYSPDNGKTGAVVHDSLQGLKGKLFRSIIPFRHIDL